MFLPFISTDTEAEPFDVDDHDSADSKNYLGGLLTVLQYEESTKTVLLLKEGEKAASICVSGRATVCG